MSGLRYDEPADLQKPPVATEKIGADHYQRIKLIDPAAGSTAGIGTSGNPMPISGAVKDDYLGGEVLAEQSGAGAVLTFTFSSAVNLVVAESSGEGLVSRADPFGSSPAAALGIPLRHEAPTFMPVITSVLKVYAPSGTTINVAGYRR